MGKNMIPVTCRVKHNPPSSYGDCVRACIASILEMQAEDVPHFYHDNCDGETGHTRIREWLASKKFVPFIVYLGGDIPLESVLEHMKIVNPGVHYMLYGNTGTDNHVVICQGDKIVHDPSWLRTDLKGPCDNGFWCIMAIAVK